MASLAEIRQLQQAKAAEDYRKRKYLADIKKRVDPGFYKLLERTVRGEVALQSADGGTATARPIYNSSQAIAGSIKTSFTPNGLTADAKNVKRRKKSLRIDDALEKTGNIKILFSRQTVISGVPRTEVYVGGHQKSPELIFTLPEGATIASRGNCKITNTGEDASSYIAGIAYLYEGTWRLKVIGDIGWDLTAPRLGNDAPKHVGHGVFEQQVPASVTRIITSTSSSGSPLVTDTTYNYIDDYTNAVVGSGTSHDVASTAPPNQPSNAIATSSFSYNCPTNYYLFKDGQIFVSIGYQAYTADSDFVGNTGTFQDELIYSQPIQLNFATPPVSKTYAGHFSRNLTTTSGVTTGPQVDTIQSYRLESFGKEQSFIFRDIYIDQGSNISLNTRVEEVKVYNAATLVESVVSGGDFTKSNMVEKLAYLTTVSNYLEEGDANIVEVNFTGSPVNTTATELVYAIGEYDTVFNASYYPAS